MNDYVIYGDSGCDIDAKLLAEWEVTYNCLTFHFEGDEREYSNEDMDTDTFYAKMRDGSVAKTSAVNTETFKAGFEKILQSGKDLIYIGFSTGLSNTCNAGQIAAAELAEKYPERKIIAVDTLSASAGYGLLLYLCVQRKKAGATIEEIAAFVEENKLHVCHWFTVEDLVYLKRGGRVSATAALVGSILNIKPVLHVDNEGHLIKTGTARGRKLSLRALADKYGELAIDPANGVIFISHGDCIDDVHLLEQMLKERYGANVTVVTMIGPVIGAHAGPGTMALFFLGKER